MPRIITTPDEMIVLNKAIGIIRQRMGFYKGQNCMTETTAAHKAGMMKAFEVCEQAIRKLQGAAVKCEACEGTGRLGCLPDDNEHTHPCDTCQPEANNEFQRGVTFAEAVARSR